MITKRIIPCLDVRRGRVVKGTNFEGIRDVADPVEMARMYNAAGADELVFYDITASFEGRALFTDILTRVASEIFIPLTVGGGINTLEDFDRVLKCGADKVSVNSGALKDPGLIPAAAQRYGNQCVVLSADVKRVDGQFRVFAKGGREDTGRDALDWISWCVALAVPVTLQGRSGTYLYGLCGEGSLILAGLVDYLCAQQKLRGAGFTVAVPTSPEQAALLQDKGFAWAFALRCLPREVERNLWSQAEFDSVTAKKLCELRERFWPDTVQLTPERMAVVLGDLYSSGATIVSSAHGYGIYFRKEDTLYFVELQADNDRAAEVLMEAAREKEVIVEKAVITVGASQPLFLGEGTRQDYGMIRFDAEPFDVAESYMRLMLEN